MYTSYCGNSFEPLDIPYIKCRWKEGVLFYIDRPETKLPMVFLLNSADEADYAESATKRREYTAYVDIFDFLIEMCGDPIGNGSRRITFSFNDDWVIKMPRYPGDESYNRTEATYSSSNRVSHAICPSYIEHFMGVDLLWMQKVKRVAFYRSINLQEYFPMDSGQTGITKDGRLVYYDYDFAGRYHDFPENPVFPIILSEEEVVRTTVGEFLEMMGEK